MFEGKEPAALKESQAVKWKVPEDKLYGVGCVWLLTVIETANSKKMTTMIFINGKADFIGCC